MPSSSNSSLETANVVVAINGFLGRTEDWQLIPRLLPQGWRLETIDLWASGPIAEFDQWTSRTSADLSDRLGKAQRKVLLGYSLGGRLGLHLLTQNPEFFDGAMIVSANPGLLEADDRKRRREADERWAEKFTNAPWSTLMNEWNSQPALLEPQHPAIDLIRLARDESSFDRQTLAQSLRAWSLGAQANLRSEIRSLKMPIEFVTGEADSKFTSIARELVVSPSEGARSHEIVANAGHRVPWDAPSQFGSVLAKFLSRW